MEGLTTPLKSTLGADHMNRNRKQKAFYIVIIDYVSKGVNHQVQDSLPAVNEYQAMRLVKNSINFLNGDRVTAESAYKF